jgi:lysophospholipase L1-like esterase
MEVDTVTLPQLEPRAIFSMNSEGERGPPRPRSKNVFRVLIAGGSSVESYFLDQYTAWSGILERKLKALPSLAGRAVHVSCVGKSGIDSGALKTILLHLLEQDKSVDMLIIMVGASDVLRWLSNGAPENPAQISKGLDGCFDRHPEVKLGWHPKQTALATLYRWQRDAKPKLRKNVGQRYAINRAMMAAAKEMRALVPDPAVIVRRYAENMRDIIASARTRNVKKIVLMRQPWFCKDDYAPHELAQFWGGSVGDPYLQHCTVYYAPQVFSKLMEAIDAAAAAVAKETGVISLELRSAVESSVDNYADQLHFTPAGSRLVADALFECVSRDGVIEPAI